MAGNRLVFDGLDELRAALRRLPEELAGEAQHEVEGAANGAAADIKRAYPVRTGRLRDGVTVTHMHQGKYHAGAIVKNRAPHAALFEYGTQARHTSIGANRGVMPPGNVFVPPIIRARHRMYQRLAEMLKRHGLVVTGDAG